MINKCAITMIGNIQNISYHTSPEFNDGSNSSSCSSESISSFDTFFLCLLQRKLKYYNAIGCNI